VNFVGIVTAPPLDAHDASEFLRTLAAFVALDLAVRLFEMGPGVGSLSSDARDLSADGEHYLAALREEGVAIEGPAGLADALASARAVVVFADPARRGVPALLTLPRGTTPDDAWLHALADAGQVRIETVVETT